MHNPTLTYERNTSIKSQRRIPVQTAYVHPPTEMMRSTTCTSILCHTDLFIYRHFCIVIFISRILLISLSNTSNKRFLVLKSCKVKKNVGGVIPVGLFCVAQCNCNYEMPATYSITGLNGSCFSKTIVAMQMLMPDNGLTC